jgi:hypothetical protein
MACCCDTEGAKVVWETMVIPHPPKDRPDGSGTSLQRLLFIGRGNY